MHNIVSNSMLLLLLLLCILLRKRGSGGGGGEGQISYQCTCIWFLSRLTQVECHLKCSMYNKGLEFHEKWSILADSL